VMSKDEEELLAQGLKEYVDARHAVTAFRQLVQKQCRCVVEDNHRDYAAALGIEPSELKLKDYKWSDGSEFYVGVIWIYKDIYAEISHCFTWSPREEGGYDTAIYAGIWSLKKNCELLREAMRKHEIAYEGAEGPDVYLMDVLAPEDVSKTDVKLEQLTEQWMNLWRNVGGIKVLSGMAK
jgi:hypothetical protein